MKLIIVRHGETPDNINDISQGQRDTILTEEGRRQAVKLGERLKNEKIDFIYSSDLTRTKQTLQEILKYHDSPVVYDQLLRERANGHYEGGSRKIFIKERENSGMSKLEFKSPSGESVNDMLERIKIFWQRLEKDHKQGESILICSHALWINTFLAFIFDKVSEEEIFKPISNCSVSIVEVSGSPKSILSNCVKHLGS